MEQTENNRFVVNKTMDSCNITNVMDLQIYSRVLSVSQQDSNRIVFQFTEIFKKFYGFTEEKEIDLGGIEKGL